MALVHITEIDSGTDRIVEIEVVEKFNPYHDEKGRFASADRYTSFTYAPGKSKAHDNAIAREKERQAAAGTGGSEKPKLAEITGTEKQVAWATDIRAKFIANAEKLIKETEQEILDDIEDEVGDEWIQRDKARLARYQTRTPEILNEVSRAGWWIEYGRGTAHDVIGNFDLAKRGKNAAAGMARFA